MPSIRTYLVSGHNADAGQPAGDPFQRQVRHLLEGHVVRQHVPRDVADLLQRPHPGGLVENVSYRLQSEGREVRKLLCMSCGMAGHAFGSGMVKAVLSPKHDDVIGRVLVSWDRSFGYSIESCFSRVLGKDEVR